MGRMNATEKQIQQENLIDLQNSNQAYSNQQKELAQYQGNIGVLSRGGSVGANPYETPGYLSNQNKMVADATSGANDSAKQELQLQNRRAGGQNTGATQADITQLAQGKMRFGSEELAQQKAQDYSKNLEFQQYLAGAPLSAASGNQAAYGTALGGQNSTANNMSAYALAQQQQQYKELNQGINAAVSGIGAV
jgi:hypothetical protein